MSLTQIEMTIQAPLVAKGPIIFVCCPEQGNQFHLKDYVTAPGTRMFEWYESNVYLKYTEPVYQSFVVNRNPRSQKLFSNYNE